MLRHLVVFKFKDMVDEKQADVVVKAFLALKEEIPTIVSIEFGTNNSTENLNKGLTHAFIVSFNNEAERDSYLTDPAHKKFKVMADPSVSDIFVFDFIVQ